jgi:ADP-ribose pyrophosphatase YjhB (NUDIX family)
MRDIKFTVRLLPSGEAVPSPHEVSAVFLIALADKNIVAIRNQRGWDIPAGHMESGESLLGAIHREAQEEASMKFKNAIPFVTVTSTSEEPKYKDKCMVGFATKDFALEEFVPATDSYEREVMNDEAFLSLYQSDKENMRLMITAAHSLLFRH